MGGHGRNGVHPPVRALLVDLNNYARYPTLAIGYLVAALRSDGIEVEVSSPLAYGVAPFEHERPETRWERLQREVYFSTGPVTIRSHDLMRSLWSRRTSRPSPVILRQAEEAIRRNRPDILLLSTYVDYYEAVVQLASWRSGTASRCSSAARS